MSLFYVDASAWVKYYTAEPGSAWMEQFWRRRPACACADLGPIEVLAALIRRSRQGRVSADTIGQMVADVDRQFAAFQSIPLNDAVQAIARQMVQRHLLRGADGIHLASAIYLQKAIGQAIVLIASDVELVSAARNEGIATIDPTTGPALP